MWGMGGFSEPRFERDGSAALATHPQEPDVELVLRASFRAARQLVACHRR